MKGLGVSLS